MSEFLNLPEGYSESDLKRAIVRNLKDFVPEIGKDFTFVGEEYRIKSVRNDMRRFRNDRKGNVRIIRNFRDVRQKDTALFDRKRTDNAYGQ